MTWALTLNSTWGVSLVDHGGLLVAANDYHQGASNQIMFSCNEGMDWQPFNFSDVSMTIFGVVTEPGEHTTIVRLAHAHIHPCVYTQHTHTLIHTHNICVYIYIYIYRYRYIDIDTFYRYFSNKYFSAFMLFLNACLYVYNIVSMARGNVHGWS